MRPDLVVRCLLAEGHLLRVTFKVRVKGQGQGQVRVSSPGPGPGQPSAVRVRSGFGFVVGVSYYAAFSRHHSQGAVKAARCGG